MIPLDWFRILGLIIACSLGLGVLGVVYLELIDRRRKNKYLRRTYDGGRKINTRKK